MVPTPGLFLAFLGWPMGIRKPLETQATCETEVLAHACLPRLHDFPVISNLPHGPMLDLCQINPINLNSPPTPSQNINRIFLDPLKLPLDVNNTLLLKIQSQGRGAERSGLSNHCLPSSLSSASPPGLGELSTLPSHLEEFPRLPAVFCVL